MLDQDGVDDVGRVVAVARLEEELREDELGGRGHPHVGAVDLRIIVHRKPFVGDRDGGGGDVEDDVEKMLLLPDLADPADVLDLDFVAALLKEGEDSGRVRRLAEDVEILGRAGDPGEAGEGVGPRLEEGDFGLLEQLQALDIEIDRLGRRLEQGRIDAAQRRAHGPRKRQLRRRAPAASCPRVPGERSAGGSVPPFTCAYLAAGAASTGAMSSRVTMNSSSELGGIAPSPTVLSP